MINMGIFPKQKFNNMNDKTLLVLGLVAIATIAFIAVSQANKGAHVTVGTPFFKAEIN